MGICHSAPTNNGAVPSRVVTASTTSTPAKCRGDSNSNDTPSSTKTATTAELHHVSKSTEPHVSDTEECETVEERPLKGGHSHTRGRTEPLRDAEKSPTQKSPGGARPRNSLTRIRPGYSSGGSSDYSDSSSDDYENSQRNHLIELKNELAADGDICKGVVHIETDFGRPIDEVYTGVHDGDVLGSGVAGIVRRVQHRKTGVNYAVKCLDLGLIRDEKGLQALREEISIMCQLDHPNIVRLEEVYESENEIFLVQELCLGGDLFDRLDDQTDFHYSEAKCAKLVKQILSSVRYLHSKNITHRDLKLENFLFSTPDPESILKMIDFGLSKHFTYAGEIQHESVGTPYTVAPEIIRGEYDEKVDIWALGVITYLLLCGETPFGGVDGESLLSVRNNILRGIVEFKPDELWTHVSDAGKDFVRRLLNPDAAKRPTAKEAQLDPWLQTYGKRDSTLDPCLNPKICQSLIQFKEYSDMRKVLCEVLSFTLLPEQIADLRTEFEKVDPDGEGEISLDSLKQVLMDSAEVGALGALTENEVEEVFNALRVRKSEKKIRWHEFIAAGLSQCNFDERNLKLAFDRLDYDRKGFITLEDMKELLGPHNGEEDEALVHMWEDGLNECLCPLGRISYEDFRMFIKGQKKDRESKRKSYRKSLKESPVLQAVPEGSISPQARHSVFAKFQDMSALEALKMPSLVGIPTPPTDVTSPKLRGADIAFPPELPLPCNIRTRSKSLGESPVTVPLIEEEEEIESAMRKSPMVVLPSKAIVELRHVIEDESRTSLVVHKALYRKHREFRQGVLEASKLFDQKRQARKMKMAENSTRGPPGSPMVKRASLVMRRGAAPHPLDRSSLHLPLNSERVLPDYEGEKMADAAKRSGRPRRPRQKTTSDISGMLR